MLVLLQPEKRHYDVFQLWRDQFPDEEFTYVLDPYHGLSKSQNYSAVLVFNSWGFTRYALKNFRSIFTYQRIYLLVHSGARFCIDIKRLDYNKISTIYYLSRAVMDFLFLFILLIRCEIEIYCLDDGMKQYMVSTPVGKFLQKRKSVEFKTLITKPYQYLEKDELDISILSGKKILMVGEFIEKRIDSENLIQLLDLLNYEKVDVVINIVGRYDEFLKNRFANYKNVKFHGFISDEMLSKYARECNYILSVTNPRVRDYGFIDQYFVTKCSGSTMFNKPVIKWSS